MKENEVLEKLMKQGRIVIFLLVAILIVLILGVSKLYNNSNKSYSESSTNTESETTEYNTEYDVSLFKEISASDIKKETKSELSVVYVGRETCGWCAAFLPNLWTAQEEYGFTTLYIDIAKVLDFTNGGVLDQTQYDVLASLSGKGYEGYMEENLGATPMILIIKDNKIIGAQTGYSEYESFETVLTDAGIKK